MKKLPERYVYPALFAYESDGRITVEFPDVPVATFGDNEEEAFLMARECLGLVMYGLEEDGDDIPAPSHIKDIKIDKDHYVSMVDVYMPSIRMAKNNKSVNRTVTLPAWLNYKALEMNINFSQILQDALKQKLKLK